MRHCTFLLNVNSRFRRKEFENNIFQEIDFIAALGLVPQMSTWSREGRKQGRAILRLSCWGSSTATIITQGSVVPSLTLFLEKEGLWKSPSLLLGPSPPAEGRRTSGWCKSVCFSLGHH